MRTPAHLNFGVSKNFEFKTLVTLHKEDSEGDSYVWKDNVEIRIYADPRLLEGVSQVVGKNGRVMKTECRISHPTFGEVTVKHRYEEMKKLKDNNEPIKIKGFKTK